MEPQETRGIGFFEQYHRDQSALERENKVLKEQNTVLLDNLMTLARGQVDALVQSLTKVLGLQRERISALEQQYHELWDKH